MGLFANRNSSQDSDVWPYDFGSHGNHMIMMSLEVMTNAITISNVSKITAAITLQITFEKGRCHGDILRKQVNII